MDSLRFVRLSLVLWVTSLTFSFTGCVPNVARTNARLEKGFDVALSAVPVIVFSGENSSGQDTDTKLWFFPELDLQFSGELSNSSALGFQLKVPVTLIYTVGDLYYQFAPVGDWVLGLGTEFGMAVSGYFCASYYFNDISYFTFTPRVIASFLQNKGGIADLSLNPQIAFGWASGVDLSVFASYGYALDEGMNVCILCDSKRDYRKHTLLSGVQLRF